MACSLWLVRRTYADGIKKRLMAAGIVTELVPVPESEVTMAIDDATRQRLFFVVVVTEQNEIHRSITVNILHGMAQGMILFAHFLLFLIVYVHKFAVIRLLNLIHIWLDSMKLDFANHVGSSGHSLMTHYVLLSYPLSYFPAVYAKCRRLLSHAAVHDCV